MIPRGSDYLEQRFGRRATIIIGYAITLLVLLMIVAVIWSWVAWKSPAQSPPASPSQTK